MNNTEYKVGDVVIVRSSDSFYFICEIKEVRRNQINKKIKYMHTVLESSRPYDHGMFEHGSFNHRKSELHNGYKIKQEIKEWLNET